jgi:hypothetical protein
MRVCPKARNDWAVSKDKDGPFLWGKRYGSVLVLPEQLGGLT